MFVEMIVRNGERVSVHRNGRRKEAMRPKTPVGSGRRRRLAGHCHRSRPGARGLPGTGQRAASRSRSRSRSVKTEKHIEIHRNGHRRAEDNAQLGGEDVHVPDHPFPAVCGHRDDHHAHHHPRKIHAMLMNVTRPVRLHFGVPSAVGRLIARTRTFGSGSQ